MLIAATQSMTALDLEIGGRETDAVLGNFNCQLCRRNRDPRIERYLGDIIGMEEYASCDDIYSRTGRNGCEKKEQTVIRRTALRPKILPGTLGSLETGEFAGVIGPRLIHPPHWIAWHPEV